MDSNHGPLGSKATALPTKPQPLPKRIQFSERFVIAFGLHARARARCEQITLIFLLSSLFALRCSRSNFEKQTFPCRAAAMRGRLWQTWKNNRAFNVKDLKFYFKPRARFFNGPHPDSFCLFSSFTYHIYCTNTINDRSVDGVLGTWSRGSRMVGADEATELWQHPN